MSDVTDLIERMATTEFGNLNDLVQMRREIRSGTFAYDALIGLLDDLDCLRRTLEALTRPADDVVREGLADIVKLLRATDQLKANGFASDAADIALGLLHDTLPKQTDAVEAERRALMAVVDAVRAYLPTDGIDAQECLNRIIGATDNPEINPIIAEIENGRA